MEFTSLRARQPDAARADGIGRGEPHCGTLQAIRRQIRDGAVYGKIGEDADGVQNNNCSHDCTQHSEVVQPKIPVGNEDQAQSAFNMDEQEPEEIRERHDKESARSPRW